MLVDGYWVGQKFDYRYNFILMGDDRVANWCRIIGKALIIIAVIFLVCSWVLPSSDEDDPRFFICILWFMGAVSVGCVFLWMASFIGRPPPTI